MTKLLNIATAAALSVAAIAPHGASAQAPALKRVATSDSMIWNAVAVSHDRIFVAGPRWTGSRGPQLAIIANGVKPRPFPDTAWNSWRPGADNGAAFININAIHMDSEGNLWIVDTGSPEFGGDPLPRGAKLVRIDLKADKVDRVIQLGPDLALPGSYVDDIRFNGDHAYLTDAGRPGIIVLDVATGMGRRVLEDHPAATARDGRPIVLSGQPVRGPDGKPLKVHSDPLEVSPDGRWLMFGPLEGPWSRVPTSLLDNHTVPAHDLAAAVEPWAGLPPVGGTAIASDGSLYFADLAEDSIKVRRPDGSIDTLVTDHALHWVDAPFLDADGKLWLPVPQMDRVGLFHGGKSEMRWPVALYTLETSR
ncbi:L-dopachrome tautomerase-related protein [Sphingobium yanoikuyae]|uniref:Major royal jelly protein n=1 Tax=Sphingobium yanoikuyae TaxID=13690 RepID=A0A291MY45_SPHYA|nr:L-dopachrome tautomerase-related protein [Sphingobium yanoikuyae]ATI80016.1 hypothetical protein A6768_08370 [Sphingobium yanoikuyae]